MKWMGFLCFGLLVACGPGLGAVSEETLTDSVRDYNDGVRWQRWDNAAAYLPQPDRGRAFSPHAWEPKGHRSCFGRSARGTWPAA